MRQALLLPAAPLLAVTLLVPPTLAQETTGRMEGRVLDANGQPIADVNVSVTSLVTASLDYSAWVATKSHRTAVRM